MVSVKQSVSQSVERAGPSVCLPRCSAGGADFGPTPSRRMASLDRRSREPREPMPLPKRGVVAAACARGFVGIAAGAPPPPVAARRLGPHRKFCPRPYRRGVPQMLRRASRGGMGQEAALPRLILFLPATASGGLCSDAPFPRVLWHPSSPLPLLPRSRACQYSAPPNMHGTCRERGWHSASVGPWQRRPARLPPLAVRQPHLSRGCRGVGKGLT